MKDDVSGLSQLGSNQTEYSYDRPRADILETFPNQYPARKYFIRLEFPEFTSLCPRTGQPDFATILVEYFPNELCVESKSLKLYLFSYRNEGSFMETITNRILEDICSVCDPQWCKVTGSFNPRGGLKIDVYAESSKGMKSA